MGQGDSTLSEKNYQHFAYRVVTMATDPQCPAKEAGIETQIDFIRYSPASFGNKLFSEFLKDNEGKEISLPIYNLIQQDTRIVKVRPNLLWGDGTSMLGTTIRYENFHEAHNKILRVLDVYLDSPSHEAELHPFNDFILGTREICFKSLDEFAKYIEINRDREIKLFVYSTATESVREVSLTPKVWEGQGLLGCDVSFGYFNKIPLRRVDEERIRKKQEILGVLNKLQKQEQKSQSSSSQTSSSGKSSEEEVVQNKKSNKLAERKKFKEDEVQSKDKNADYLKDYQKNILKSDQKRDYEDESSSEDEKNDHEKDVGEENKKKEANGSGQRQKEEKEEKKPSEQRRFNMLPTQVEFE